MDNNQNKDEINYKLVDSSPSFTKELFSTFVENVKNDKLAVIGGLGALGLATASAITATVGAPIILPAVVATLTLGSLFIEKGEPYTPEPTVPTK